MGKPPQRERAPSSEKQEGEDPRREFFQATGLYTPEQTHEVPKTINMEGFEGLGGTWRDLEGFVSCLLSLVPDLVRLRELQQ